MPQCVSKWVTRRVAVLVRLRLHRETMAPADLCTRVYVRTGRRKPFPLPHPPSSRTVYIGMVGCRKFLATRIVWIAVRLFLMVIPRVHLVLPSTSSFFVFYVKRVSIFKLNPSTSAFRSVQVIKGTSASGLRTVVPLVWSNRFTSTQLKYICHKSNNIRVMKDEAIIQ